MLFDKLTSETRKKVFLSMNPLEVLPKTVIIQQGDTEASMFYVLESGACDVLIAVDGSSKVVHQYKAGRCAACQQSLNAGLGTPAASCTSDQYRSHCTTHTPNWFCVCLAFTFCLPHTHPTVLSTDLRMGCPPTVHHSFPPTSSPRWCLRRIQYACTH